MIRISYIFILLLFAFVSCKSDAPEEKKDADSTRLSKKTDLRQSMNGYWVLISQSFTKGRKLEKFPVGGTVGIIFNEKDEWFSVTRNLGVDEDTISYGTFYLERNHIVMEVISSKDPTSYIRLNGTVDIFGRFLQMEGRMMYKGDRLAEYTHAIFGKSARSLEDVFDSKEK